MKIKLFCVLFAFIAIAGLSAAVVLADGPTPPPYPLVDPRPRFGQVLSQTGGELPVSPRPLVDPRRRFGQVLSQTGGARPLAAELTAMAAPPMHVTWWAYDHFAFSDYQINLTLRYTSTYAYIYVDDASYTPALDAGLADIGLRFDANYASTTGGYGSPPNVDGESRIFLAITDIRDEYYYDPSATTYVPCFFDPNNEHAGATSNLREILYLDLEPTPANSDEAGRCLTHQLALMINYNYDPAEMEGDYYWAAEGFADLAEFTAGYGHRPEVEEYLKNPDNPLQGWSGSQADTGKVYLWSLYLRERFGQAKVRQIFQSPLHGLDAIQPALGISPRVLFQRWVTANWLDDDANPAQYDYHYAELNIVTGGADKLTSFTRPPLYAAVSLSGEEKKVITGTLSGYYAARYISIQRADNYGLKIADVSPDFNQSTLINGAVTNLNWTGQITNTTFAPGDQAILITGLGQPTGSLTYRYNAGQPDFPKVYLPVILNDFTEP